jgi:hypothetical protein
MKQPQFRTVRLLNSSNYYCPSDILPAQSWYFQCQEKLWILFTEVSKRLQGFYSDPSEISLGSPRTRPSYVPSLDCLLERSLSGFSRFGHDTCGQAMFSHYPDMTLPAPSFRFCDPMRGPSPCARAFASSSNAISRACWTGRLDGANHRRTTCFPDGTPWTCDLPPASRTTCLGLLCIVDACHGLAYGNETARRSFDHDVPLVPRIEYRKTTASIATLRPDWRTRWRGSEGGPTPGCTPCTMVYAMASYRTLRGPSGPAD